MVASVLLAVDGGNSKTAALLLDAGGRVVARLLGPGSGGGPDHLAAVLGGMLATAPGGPVVRAAAVAAAGLDFPEDETAFEAALSRLLPSARVRVMNDAAAVLRAAHDGHGVAVVCGAGLNAVAVGPSGVAGVPAIDWMSGDRGGGHELGREAVRIGYRSWDGRGPRSVLERTVLEETGAADFVRLARLLRDDALGEDVLDRLSPLLTAAAAEGDAPATEAMERTVEEIRLLVRSIVARAWPDDAPPGTPVALAGGVFRAPVFARRVGAVLGTMGLWSERVAFQPVLGAAMAVASLAGVGDEATAALRRALAEEGIR